MSKHNVHPVFTAAREAWEGASPLREKRRRARNFTYGRQWGDKVTTPNGYTMAEGEYMKRFGCNPQTNNLIHQLVKCVMGRYHSIQSEGGKSGSLTQQEQMIRNVNHIDELDVRTLEEFLISGCAIHRVSMEKRIHSPKASVYVDPVSPERFIVNRFTDPRGWDIELVGMLHDMSATEAVMRFAHGDAARGAAIRSILASSTGDASLLAAGADEEVSFHTARRGKHRVVEVWTLESVEALRCHDLADGGYFMLEGTESRRLAALNARRRKSGRALIEFRRETTLRWKYRYFTGAGALIDEGFSPYPHDSHPFAVRFFPMNDGEVHSFVEDVIDQQRVVNRMLTLIDHIMNHSAKGVLLFPASCKVNEMDWMQVADEWTRVNGVIPYNAAGGFKPEQVIGKGNDCGASELLSIEMKLMERVSGISETLRGDSSGTQGAELYKSRLENATLSIADMLKTFASFQATRDEKIVSLCNII